MRKLFKERKLIKGGNYMRKYGILLFFWYPVFIFFLFYYFEIPASIQYSGQLTLANLDRFLGHIINQSISLFNNIY